MSTSPATVLAAGLTVLAGALLLTACDDPAPEPETTDTTSTQIIDDAPALARVPEFTPPVVDVHSNSTTSSPVTDSRVVTCDDIDLTRVGLARDTEEGRWWPVKGGWVLADGSWCV